MSDIDKCDQMLSYYSSSKKTIKWYKKVMFHLLDITMWNSFYLFKKRFPHYKGHYIDYHRKVVKSLIDLPTNVTTGNQLISNNSKNKLIKRNYTNTNTTHSQEKIPLPEGNTTFFKYFYNINSKL